MILPTRGTMPMVVPLAAFPGFCQAAAQDVIGLFWLEATGDFERARILRVFGNGLPVRERPPYVGVARNLAGLPPCHGGTMAYREG